MPFPREQRGEFPWRNLRALDVEEFRVRFLAQAAGELKAVKAKDVEISNNKVLFKGGVFRFVPNWNILIWIDRGYIEAVPTADGLSISICSVSDSSLLPQVVQSQHCCFLSLATIALYQ